MSAYFLKHHQELNVELGSLIDKISDLLFGSTNKDRKHAISKLVRYFLKKADIQKQNIFQHELLD